MKIVSLFNCAKRNAKKKKIVPKEKTATIHHYSPNGHTVNLYMYRTTYI